ncbi:hypothetical protein [Pedobacter gandavensis]|uniref:hypothetical protein n=1 Tax=Pedobacter gandavensis TaxID=2679963 RepID=UPI0029314381|nr:hypothetical protein [Pedobacter gandavensis]
MKKLLSKSVLLKSGLFMSALVVTVLGFSNLNGNPVNNQTEVKLRNVARVESSSAFAIRDAKASLDLPAVAETVKCGENASGCTATLNGTAGTITGKKD